MKKLFVATSKLQKLNALVKEKFNFFFGRSLFQFQTLNELNVLVKDCLFHTNQTKTNFYKRK